MNAARPPRGLISEWAWAAVARLHAAGERAGAGLRGQAGARVPQWRGLRHAHATELISSGVSIAVVRRRLGRASTETTQVYTELADQVADTEIRAARRRRGSQL
jgi:site-specific recombinase XerC